MKALVSSALVLAFAGLMAAQDKPATPVADATQPDPAVEAWVKTLGAKIADGNKVVRDSAQQGLVAVGKPAATHLQTLSAGEDKAVAAEAKKVLERIERMAARGEAGNRPGARPEGGRRDGMQQGMDALTKDLNLDPEQEAKVANALEERSKRMRDLFSQVQDGALTREEMRSEMQKMSDDVLKSMKGVMNAEQYSKFEESFKRLGSMGGGARRRGGG